MQEFDPTGRPRTTPGLVLDPVSGSVDNASVLLANHILRRLGPDAAATVMGAGRRVQLRAGQTLWLPGEAVEAIGFPLNGVIAGLAADLDGSAAQVESIGPEGVVGLVEGLAGAPLAFEHRAMVETEMWLVPAEVVRGLMRACPAAAETIQRHIADLYDRARRASACAARHALRARLADCLLDYQEKTALVRLPLTQEMLSTVLGANRTTVTALAIALSDAGLTRTGRGWISVVDAERLDRLACGCRKAGAASDIKAAPSSSADA
jgi:CRP-like cAMP-binding protein